MRQGVWLAVGLVLIAFVKFDSDRVTRAADAESTLPVILIEGFESGMDRWQTTDPEPSDPVWKIIEAATERGQTSNHVFRVTGMSKYQPPFRSPLSIAWLKDVKVGDFELTTRVQNTSPSGGPHRDLCIFWGRQSPSEFYYAHFGAQADPHACQIFIVNNSDRTMITRDQAKGTPWTDGWHNLKVTRHAGTMKAYFDDVTQPLMTAQDTTFGAGEIGIGTFDDSGNFDEVVLRGDNIAN